jgi:pyridoxine/pyridoxamine 5'-phosphate oxidase
MDSINQQQPEQNHQDLQATDAIKKMQELADKAKTCFFSTRLRSSDVPATRPMGVQEVDDQGHFWFLSANDSHKNQEIQQDPFCTAVVPGFHASRLSEHRGHGHHLDRPHPH